MRSTTRRNLAAAAVIAVIIAAALVCTAAGTLTAFSARYTWQSDEGMSGSFPFEDTEYTLALFDGAAGFLPGDGGSALLEGPSFALLRATRRFGAFPRTIPRAYPSSTS